MTSGGTWASPAPAESDLARLATVLRATSPRRDWRAISRALLATRRSQLDSSGRLASLLGTELAERTAFYARASAAVPVEQRAAVGVAAALIEDALATQNAASAFAPFELLVTDFMLAHACMLLAREA